MGRTVLRNVTTKMKVKDRKWTDSSLHHLLTFTYETDQETYN